MGMYTELHFNSELIKDVPEDVIRILKYMVGDDEYEIGKTKCDAMNHDLFGTGRWGFMLHCDSYYFSADTKSTLRFDDISKSYFLCIRTNLKNYDGEIEKFIDWIHPYLDEFDGDYLGHYRYEEDTIPRLIFKNRVVGLTEATITASHTIWERKESSHS